MHDLACRARDAQRRDVLLRNRSLVFCDGACGAWNRVVDDAHLRTGLRGSLDRFQGGWPLEFVDRSVQAKARAVRTLNEGDERFEQPARKPAQRGISLRADQCVWRLILKAARVFLGGDRATIEIDGVRSADLCLGRDADGEVSPFAQLRRSAVQGNDLVAIVMLRLRTVVGPLECLEGMGAA